MKVPAWKRRAAGKKMMALGRRSKLRKGQIGRGLRQPVQFFKRSKWTSAQIVAETFGGSSPYTMWSITPTLADVPDYTDFTNLYDQYQIKAVKVTLFPKFSQSEGASSIALNSNNLPQVMSSIDYDGSVGALGVFNPSNLAQYQSFKITRGNKLHSRYFRPQVLSTVFSGGITSAYSVARYKWIDTTRTDVPHFGCYGIVDMSGGNTDTRVVYDVKVDYYISCKNVR